MLSYVTQKLIKASVFDDSLQGIFSKLVVYRYFLNEREYMRSFLHLQDIEVRWSKCW